VIDLLKNWYKRHFSDPQVAILAFINLCGLAVIVLAGDILAPLLFAIVIAYVLDGAIDQFVRLKVPRFVALSVVFALFLTFLVSLIFGLLPMLLRQSAQFFREVPNMISQGQALLMELPESYPKVISQDQVVNLIGALRNEMSEAGQYVLSTSISSVIGLITLMVYLILVPLLVFFFLKDKQKILDWAGGFLPEERGLSVAVWGEVNRKIASYIRGKIGEIVIIWGVSYVTFMVLGLDFAMLLSFLVGISVVVPYVGAAVVTLPVAVVAYYQWGFTSDFGYTLVAYGVIQFIDGNLLVPILFSEVVNLHPVAIITAVLVFGGIWGFWGVFFAIPLATLIHAVINVWPDRAKENASPQVAEVSNRVSAGPGSGQTDRKTGS
jgi:putative permease